MYSLLPNAHGQRIFMNNVQKQWVALIILYEALANLENDANIPVGLETANIQIAC